MASVTDSHNRLNAAEATTNWGSDGGGGAGVQQEPDFVFQGTYSVSRKNGTGKRGFAYTHTTTVDMTAGDNQVWIAKGAWANSSALAGFPAACHRIGNSSSNQYEYNVRDDGTQGDIDVDVKELWIITPIDPNEPAWPDTISGTVTLTSIDFYGIQSDFTATSKSENVCCDAVDLSDGLWLTGSSPDGTFQDFVDHDEGTTSTRIGHVTTIKGIIQVYGTLSIGRNSVPIASATTFNDTGRTLIFPKGFYSAGWTGIFVDLGNASTDVDLDAITMIGQGQNDQKYFFDSASDINATTDVVTLPGDEYITGTPVRYSKEGGTDTTGLTDNTLYWVRRTAADTVAVYSSRANARADSSRVALSVGSGGEAHSFTREPDIRPDFTVTGTNGAFDATGCRFEAFRQIVLTSSCTLTSCTLVDSGLVDMTTNSGGDLNGCSINGASTNPGEAFVQTDSLAYISNCDFTASSSGHAIEIDSTGTFSFDSNTFTGYGPDGATFTTDSGGIDASGEVITTDAAHGFSDGDEVYYNNEGGSASIGLTNGNRYYVNSITTTTLSLHVTAQDATSDSNRVNLSTSGAESHTLYSGNAAIYNSSGGAVTISVTGTGTSPTVRNGTGASTTVTANKNLDIHVQDAATNDIQNAVVAVYNSSNDTELVNELTDVNGDITTAAIANGTSLYIRVRKSTSGTRYVPFETIATLSNDLTLTVTLIEDTIAS